MTRESSHDSVYELLPWYANHTLSREESAVVEEHLARCADCMQELRHLYEVSEAMKDVDEAPSPSASFAKTLSAIEEWESTRPRSAWQHIRTWFQTLWTPSAPMARAVFAAQLGLILVLAGTFLFTRLNEKPYTTLSGGDSQGRNGARLNIIFEADATEETLRGVLLDSGGNVVSGPSALGVYVVELSGVSENDPKVEAEIAKLRARTGIVRFVERQP